MQVDVLVDLTERFQRQPRVAGTVFDQQNLNGHAMVFHDRS
jgi:hypothetical protein